MPDPRRAKCQRCGVRREDTPTGISWEGLCVPCAEKAVATNVDGLYYKRGEPWKAWRRGMARCVGAVLLDDAAPDS